MQFTTLGEKSLPAVLLIHGMLSSGDDPLIFGKYLADDYYVISPTLDGHANDGSELESAEKEAEKICKYLKSKGITELALIQGSSMGAEVAIALYKECKMNGINVGKCFFDGGPFFNFNPVKRMIMALVFKRLIKLLDGEPDEVFDKLNRNGFVRFVAKDKLEDFKPILISMANNHRTFSGRTIKGMVNTCYHCILPEFPEEEQRKFLFMFSVDEPARDSKPRLKKAYPYAKFRDLRGYAHCGFQFKRPAAYANLLKKAIEGRIA